jgi:hypothetical protein
MVRASRRSPVAAAVGLALVLSACGGAEQAPPAPTTPRTLAAMPQSIAVQPGGTGTLTFELRGPTGEPLAGAVVTFAIVEGPTADAKAQGATLVAASATTDAAGHCAARLMAGLDAIFRVRATSADAVVDVTVIVGAGEFGAVDIAPFFLTPAGTHADATVEILFYDNSSCVGLDLRNPPPTVRPGPPVPASGGAVATYENVSTRVGDAIVGRARDARSNIVALGCIDLPGRSLVANGAVQIALPLVDVGPDPAGTYVATSPFTIAPPLPAAAAIAATWSDLTDCPLDPAQLWLDCTIDALGPASDADPLDCVPATTAGGDGALGDALGAMRAPLLAGPDGAPTTCRGAQLGAAPSLDAIVDGLFGSPVPLTFIRLAAAADDASHLFDQLQLRSTLDVRAAGSLTDVAITHTLTSLAFGLRGSTSDVALVTLGLPVLTTTTTGTASEDTLTIARHGFTLRLGAAARAAFGSIALARRGLPADAAGVVAAIAGLAHNDDGKLAGCVALDDALCPRAGRATGCLVTACATGLNALSARLEAAFADADGADLDLYLAGSAPLLETHDDGLAGRLGDLTPGARAGTWSVDLRPRGNLRSFSAPWEAIRSGN